MLKTILKPVLLTTLICVAGLSRAASAQQPKVLTGEWVGNSEPAGTSEFLRLSLGENAGEMQRPQSRRSGANIAGAKGPPGAVRHDG